MSRRTIYANRGRTPRNCYTCDGIYACTCSAVEIRAAKRGAKQQWNVEDAAAAKDYVEAKLDVDDYDHCGGSCDHCSAWPEWLEYLRSQAIYPAPALAQPVLKRAA